jgi:anti-anti-sigma factor
MAKNFKIEVVGSLAIITPQTDFTLFYCSEILDELDRLVEKKIRHVIFDFHFVTWLDSIAVVALAKAGRMANTTGKKTVVVDISEKMKFILEQKSLEKFLNILPTMEKAKHYFL